MRCDRCGTRMEESHKDSIFRGLITVYRCPGCSRRLKESEGGSIISSLLRHHYDEGDLDMRRADPVSFSPVGRR